MIVFGRTKYNLYLLASPESLEDPMKPTSKDKECTGYSTNAESRGECNYFHKFIGGLDVVVGAFCK